MPDIVFIHRIQFKKGRQICVKCSIKLNMFKCSPFARSPCSKFQCILKLALVCLNYKNTAQQQNTFDTTKKQFNNTAF